MHAHVGTIQGQGLFCSAQAGESVGEQFKGGKNSRKYGISYEEAILKSTQPYLLRPTERIIVDVKKAYDMVHIWWKTLVKK